MNPRAAAVLAMLALLTGAAGDESVHAAEPMLRWEMLPSLPDALGVAGPFVGVHNDALIVAGGANFPSPPWESAKTWLADLWVMTRGAEGDAQWHTGLRLDQPIAHLHSKRPRRFAHGTG
jgi:solute:Na+ symporter, SSS family